MSPRPTTEPFSRLALVPSDAPNIAVAEVVISLIASAPPTPPLALGVLDATDVADVEKLLLLSARTANVLPLGVRPSRH